MRKYLIFFLSALGGVGAALGLGFLLRGAPKLVGILVFSISCALLVAGFAVGACVYIATRKKLAQMTPSARLLVRERNSGRDYATTLKRVKGAYILYVFTVAAMVVAHFTALLGATLMRLQLNSSALSALMIIAIIFFAIMFAECMAIFLGATPRETFELELTSETHPKIYEFVMNIVKKMGITKVVHVVVVADNQSGALLTHNEVYIILAMRNLEDKPSELEAILTHELARLQNPKVKRASRYFNLSVLTRAQTQNSVILGFIPRIICYPTAENFINEYDFYNVCENFQLELEADDYIAKAGKGQQYIDACAKLSMLNLYLTEPMKENVYSTTFAPTDYFHKTDEAFKDSYMDHGDKWRELLANEGQAEFTDCPTLKTHMERMGIDNYTICFSCSEEFYAEKENIIGRYNKGITPPAEAWARMHKEQYLDYQAQMERYELYSRHGEKQDGRALTEAGMAYGNLCKTNKAMQLFNKAIAQNPRNARALFFKGMTLIAEFDDSGVEFIREAVTLNFNYFEEGISEIYRYCNLKNLKEQYAQMKEWRQEQLYRFVNILPKQNDITYYTSLEEWDIEETDEIAAELNNFRMLNGIYFIKKHAKKENITTYNVGVTFLPGLPQELKEYTMHHLFDYLDNFDLDASKPDINFMLVEINPFVIKRFFKNTQNRKKPNEDIKFDERG